MPKKQEISLEEIGGLFKEGLHRAASRPSIHGYVPHDKQVTFHSTRTKGRLYIGGNRSGKTVGGVVEDIYRLRGQHPYQPVPPAPVRGRVVTTSLAEGLKMIMIPEFAKWIPPSDLKNGSWEDSYNKNDKMLTLANGSTCEFMTYEQKLEKFAGTSRHFIHFDEEPPKPIFDECRMRLLDTGGPWYITMTPVEGMTWVYDELYVPSMVPGGNVTIIQIDTEENPYLSQAEIDEVFGDITDPDQVKIRKQGQFIEIGGTVFKKFNVNKNTVDPLEEDQLRKIFGWTHYASLDHGLNNPTCWLWHAVSPNGLIITYDEIYDSERLIGDYAREIHERNKFPGRRAPEIYVGDPSIAQRNAQTGDSIQLAYIKEGVPIVLGNNDVAIGVEKMNSHFNVRKWIVTSNCQNFIKQLQRVRWKTFETAKKRYDNNRRDEIHKKDDHAVDSARYFAGLMPELHIPPPQRARMSEMSGRDIIKQALMAGTTYVGSQQFDLGLRDKQRPQSTEWHHVDEHMGGLY